MKPIIEINNLSKQYRLGQVGTGSLHHDINRWWHKARGKDDPYIRIGESNDRTTKANGEYVWALKDISFTVQPGEVLGIIGRNGAGKSTLLKILSRITAPTTGSYTLRGRVASLLEVGTGMHPELTGRENVYLNGAILGMRRKEIDRKLDAIVDFSGVERYIDTPVKRYSSGMHVRLGFAVAAHLEPDILIVDEVLAVGDAEFQKKCIGKMKDVSESEGRTVLFVSHNLAAVGELCQRGLVLHNGQGIFNGSIELALSKYLNESTKSTTLLKSLENVPRQGNKRAVFETVKIYNKSGEVTDSILTGDSLLLEFTIKINDKSIKQVDLGFSLHDKLERSLTYLYSGFQQVYFQPNGSDYLTIRCELENFSFTEPLIYLKGRLLVDKEEADWPKCNLGILKVQEGNFYGTGHSPSAHAPVLIKGKWS